MTSSGTEYVRPITTNTDYHFKVKSVGADGKEPEELCIKVPWGHIAAKWWGPKDVRPIVGLHGWMDNAGTFDRLAPLLPKHISLLTIDFPGHGLSSRLPAGMPYDKNTFLLLIRMLQKEYKWEKISLMGHSMGAIMGFGYTSMFPSDVDMMIAIDGLKFFYYEPAMYVPMMQGILGGMAVENERQESQSEPPSYEYETLVNKLHDGMLGAIEKDVAPYLLRRGIKRSEKYPDRYYFARDGRLKYLHALTFEKTLCDEMAKRITAPYLFIGATQSGHINRESAQHSMEFIQFFRGIHPKLELHSVAGKHHLHLNTPEKVSGIINEFINRIRPAPQTEKSKL